MYFLLQYDRAQGQLVSVAEYSEQSSDRAHRDRLRIELVHFHDKNDIEVVLLQARDLSSLRTTHRRYFETISSLVTTIGTGA